MMLNLQSCHEREKYWMILNADLKITRPDASQDSTSSTLSLRFDPGGVSGSYIFWIMFNVHSQEELKKTIVLFWSWTYFLAEKCVPSETARFGHGTRLIHFLLNCFAKNQVVCVCPLQPTFVG